MVKEDILKFVPWFVSFVLGLAVSAGSEHKTLETINNTLEKVSVRVETMDQRINSNDRVMTGTIQQLQDNQKYMQSQLDRLDQRTQPK